MQTVIAGLVEIPRAVKSALISFALAVAMIAGAGAARSDVPVLYHSPLDDGEPPAAVIDLGPEETLTLFLYRDAIRLCLVAEAEQGEHGTADRVR